MSARQRPGTRLATRLGLDGNSLRRRTDLIAAYGAIGLLAVFLLATPLLSIAVGRWDARGVLAEQQVQQGWHQVTAVLRQSAPVIISYQETVDSLTMAQWAAPAGHRRSGLIPVMGGAAAGSHVRIWVDAAGQWSGPPLNHRAADLEIAGTVAAVPVVLALALLGVAYLSRRLLQWRRLAGWESGWTTVGPQWTRQFRARG